MISIPDYVVSFKQIIGEYSFRLEQLPEVEIKIRLSKYIGIEDERIHFETSHYIKTPTQCGPYLTSRASEDTEVIAIERAIDTIVSFYKDAINQGYEPSYNWLIKNSSYDED